MKRTCHQSIDWWSASPILTKMGKEVLDELVGIPSLKLFLDAQILNGEDEGGKIRHVIQALEEALAIHPRDPHLIGMYRVLQDEFPAYFNTEEYSII